MSEIVCFICRCDICELFMVSVGMLFSEVEIGFKYVLSLFLWCIFKRFFSVIEVDMLKGLMCVFDSVVICLKVFKFVVILCVNVWM